MIYKVIVYAVIVAIFLWRIVSAYKKGFVKELANAVSIGLAILIGILIKGAVLSFMSQNLGTAVGKLILLSLVIVIYKIIHLIFTSMKIFASLPVIKFINKLLGAVLGLIEAFGIVVLIVEVFK